MIPASRRGRLVRVIQMCGPSETNLVVAVSCGLMLLILSGVILTFSADISFSNKGNGVGSAASSKAVEAKFGNYSSVTPEEEELPEDVYIRVFMVMDYSLYESWISLDNRNINEVLADIHSYYNYMLKLVNEMFAKMETDLYNYKVSGVGMHVSQTKQDTLLIEGGMLKMPNSNLTEYEIILGMVPKWIRAEKNRLPRFEVLGVLTSIQDKMAAGMALINTACSTNGAFIVKNGPMKKLAKLFAHELAHVLGVKHDGDVNDCKVDEMHIMTRDVGTFTLDSFSYCSREYMDDFVDLTKSPDTGCFEKDPKRGEEEVEGRYWSRDRLLGARFSPDKICQIAHGKKSYFCPKGEDSRSICHSFKCYSPQWDGCYALDDGLALDGVSCANKSWCLDGECMYDEMAPVKKERCMYGDWKRTVEVEKVNYWCRDVFTMPSLCYHNNVRRLCCASCNSVKKSEAAIKQTCTSQSARTASPGLLENGPFLLCLAVFFLT